MPYLCAKVHVNFSRTQSSIRIFLNQDGILNGSCMQMVTIRQEEAVVTRRGIYSLNGRNIYDDMLGFCGRDPNICCDTKEMFTPPSCPEYGGCNFEQDSSFHLIGPGGISWTPFLVHFCGSSLRFRYYGYNYEITRKDIATIKQQAIKSVVSVIQDCIHPSFDIASNILAFAVELDH